MAYKNVEVKCGGYEPLRIKDAYIQTFATSSTPNYDGEQYFDLTKPHDMISVGQSEVKTITFGSTIQISIDNTGSSSYIQIFANGTRITYHTLGSKRTEFYIVVVGDADNQNGLGSVIVETSSYNWCCRKCADSTVNAAIYDLLNPSTWEYFTNLLRYTVSTTNYDVLSIPSNNNTIVNEGNNPCIINPISGSFDNTIQLNENSYIRIWGGTGEMNYKLRINNVDFFSSTSWPGSGYYTRTDFFLGIDDTTERARFICYNQQVNRGTTYTNVIYDDANDTKRANLYILLKGLIFNWQSVPAITGKGETVNLSTLNDINDGDQVITTDTSKFNKASENNLYTLIAKQL